MTFRRLRRRVACALVLALTASTLTPAWAEPGAVFTGRVVQADGVSPRTGAVVALFDGRSDLTFRSEPTRGDGAFRIDQAPAGSYGVIVETDQGAFALAQPMSLAPGANTPLALKLSAQATDDSAPVTTASKDQFPPWAKWVIVGVISAAALLVINDLSEDKDEEPASPF